MGAFYNRRMETAQDRFAEVAYDDVARAHERIRGVVHRTPVLRSATIDALTGACNRRHFDERLGVEWNRALRQDSADPLVTAVVEPWGRNSSREQRDLAARLTDVINRVWAENDGRA